MSHRPSLRHLLRAAVVPVALAFALAGATIVSPTQASAEHGRSAGKRCSGLYVASDNAYSVTGRIYNVSCAQARSYSRTLPPGWSGASRYDGANKGHALYYRSRDAKRVMRAIRPGGATANTRILGRRPLIIIPIPSGGK